MASKPRELDNRKNYGKLQRHVQRVLHVSDGKVGDVVFGVGGTTVSPPLSVDQVEHYVGVTKGFPEINRNVFHRQE